MRPISNQIACIYRSCSLASVISMLAGLELLPTGLAFPPLEVADDDPRDPSPATRRGACTAAHRTRRRRAPSEAVAHPLVPRVGWRAVLLVESATHRTGFVHRAPDATAAPVRVYAATAQRENRPKCGQLVAAQISTAVGAATKSPYAAAIAGYQQGSAQARDGGGRSEVSNRPVDSGRR
jgi:hypothetical protein